MTLTALSETPGIPISPHWFGNADDHHVEFLSILGPQGERVHIKARFRPDDDRPL
ncbi:hypothetical protein [Streptomyces sp. RK9]|uniref:hypothetical protein n=1 Tax=Streptomyces sp. RK9 TaxID=3239284 RepID=UPI0038657637